uniref:Uncharacterized protein n=1 Tax=Timema tahoe TaxID=61484 RepID=A0A7R9INN8_9NEOP|nr:unnamed protein product [Timema tahoe]
MRAAIKERTPLLWLVKEFKVACLKVALDRFVTLSTCPGVSSNGGPTPADHSIVSVSPSQWRRLLTNKMAFFKITLMGRDIQDFSQPSPVEEKKTQTK